ncbi:putative ribonuclease H-like domain-containing protein [Tanacetum coccineum]
MEAGTASTTLTANLPILIPGNYDLWLMRIEQYFLMTDYSLWEEHEPTTAEEKQDRRNEMKARGTLLMALLNKDQLKFHSYKDAKLLMEAIEKRYGGNKESKKVQRTLLKQQYENFLGLSSETMDQTFDRLKKLISQLEIQGEVITQEDMNLKLLRSLPSEWKTHALIWRNKKEIETISLDDFTNSNCNSSTNEADNTAHGVSAHTQCNSTSGDNLSDVMICDFLASQPNSPKLTREDLEQINPDDLEEMDLQWEMAMLTIRARRFIQRTDRKLDVNGQRVGFDKTKVECYNCHKYGHFARECRVPRNQENRGRENNRRTVTVETPTENSLVAQDGLRGYDWSYQAEEEHPTNFALMAYTSLGSSSSSDSEVDSCSKSCLESVEARLAHYKKNEVVFEESINVLKLEVKLRDTALVENKKKLEKAEKERDELKLTLEKFQNSSKSLNNLLESQVIDKFKTGLGYNAASSTTASPAVESFMNSSEMLEIQENNKSRFDKGYHAVPLPFTGNFIPRKPDLTFMDEIVESENMDVTTIVTPSNVKTVESNLESAGVKSNGDAVEPKTVRMNRFRPPVIEDWNSDDDSEVEFIPNVENKSVRPSTEKIKFAKSARETPKQNKHYPRGNQRNWNNLMSQRLGSDFKMINKACFVCGSFEHLHYVCDKKVIRPVWNNSSRVNHKNFANKITHPHPNRRFVPQAVLTKSGKINTAGASVNTAVRPVNTAGSKPTVNHPRPISNAYKKGYSQVTRPFNKYSEYKNSIFNKKVNTVRVKDTTARDRAVVSENKGKGVNVVKASACWNGVAERRNKTLIEAIRTMVLVIKPHNKTPYELIYGRTPLIDFMKPFGYPVTILNTREHLGKFDGKADEGFFVGTSVSAAGPTFTNDDPSSPVNAAEASNAFKEHLFERFSPFKDAFTLLPISNVTPMDDTVIFGNAYDDEDVGAEADLNNLETTINVSPIPTTRIDKDHPKDQIIGDFNSAIQIRRMTKIFDEHAMDPRWIKAMQEELLQFQLQKVWTLVNLPNGKRAIRTRWVFRNKKDERGIIVRNKARLVAQGYTQEEGIDYDEVFAPIARIEAIRLFLVYASFMGFIVYQMDVKNAFLYGTIDEEVYVYQPPGFEDPQFPDKVYKVEKALYGLHQAPRAWFETLSTYLIENGFRRGTIDKTLFIKKDKGDILLVQVYVDDIIFGSTKKFLYDGLKKEDKIFISQDKYVDKILKKFNFATVKIASTPMEPNKALVKDKEADSMDVHLYRSMIRSLMYLTTSRPDIMFAVCAYARDSPFNLEAFSDSDYARASLDRKSTTGGCQFLSKRLISWQCKKQTIVANSTTEAEYVAAANCCGHIRLSIRSGKTEWKRAATTASIDAEQDNGSGPRCQDTILGGADDQTRFETASKQSNDPLLSRGYTLKSGEDSMKLLKTLILDEARSPEFNLFSDLEEYSEEEVAETMELYMRKTRADYGSGIARPKIDDKYSFELKG